MSKDVKTLRMLSFFLALFIISKTWMHYQKCYSTFYPSVDHLNRVKSYLRGDQMTKDTNGYLVVEILLSLTYGVNG